MYANLLFELPVDLLEQRFLATDLGKLYQSIPFDELAGQVAEPKGKLSGKGRKNWLSIKGAIGSGDSQALSSVERCDVNRAA